MDDRHLIALEKYFGFTEFRPLQQEIVEDLVADKDVFVLMPTGGGKSLCYQLPALLKDGLAVVVSPLIALMKDQVDAMRELGVPAIYINSTMDPVEVGEQKDRIRRGAVKMLFCAPERLVMPDFLQFLASVRVSFFAIDEAHCISQWGHDFREDYRRLDVLRTKFPRTPIIAMTATATPRVAEDILDQLKLRKPSIYKASFERTNLSYWVLPKQPPESQLVPYLKKHRGESGIIYCISRKRTEELADLLTAQGISAKAYHAGMDSASRTKVQNVFKRDSIDVICATIAFGMGIDKPNVRFVIHYELPRNLEGYYQETGRAGRDGQPAECILYYSRGDRSKYVHFIEKEEVSPERKRAEYEKLDIMCGYAESHSCRKEYLIRYFGEEYSCIDRTKCDICLKPGQFERSDATEVAQKFLSAMVRTEERFGMNYLIDVLRGKEDDRILHNRHHTLPTYGVGKSVSKAQWQHYARELIREEYIWQDDENYGILKLRPKGRQALFERQPIELVNAPEAKRSRMDATEQGSSGPTNGPVIANQDLFDALRSLRRSIADEHNVPAYVIFHDAVLREMAAVLPKTLDDLGKIVGVGQTKLERYGTAFLKVIDANRAHATPSAPPLRAEYEPPAIAASAALSRSLYEQGCTLEQIAKSRGLASSTVATHLEAYIASGDITDISRLVVAEKIEPILDALKKAGSMNSLGAVKQHLNASQFTYEDVRFVRAWEYCRARTALIQKR
ncbi:MAG: DNA helicase RecQ [Bacteroidetes bacterium]|nr:DNA helicase RecQ [Bacteroidota bacterium]